MDVAALRADTPGCANVVHLNNAGSSLPPRPVIEVQRAWIMEEAGVGGYEMAETHASKIEDVYRSIARLIGSTPEEIALVENATLGWWQALHSLNLEGRTILTSEVDYGSNFVAYLQIARRVGARIEVVPSGETGELSLGELERRIDESVGLIAISHMPTNGGVINPAEEVGGIANREGIPYLLDACQTVGQIPVDVEAIGCDFLSATGRKYLRGPRGTGFLYVRSGWTAEPMLLDMRGATLDGPYGYRVRPDARRFELWEGNQAARIGLGAAVDYATRVGLNEIATRVADLADHLRTRLTAAGLPVHDLGRRRGGIVTFTVPGVDAGIVKMQLRERHINVSTSDPGSTPVDSSRRHLPEIVRASVHYFNTHDELELLVAAVAEIVS